jgi:hypothetical protein
MDLDAVIINPIASVTLKWLRFSVMRWMLYLHHPALLNLNVLIPSFVLFL